ncbi:MAG TPA: GNAT family N-acetyltransferase [Actinomycetota bacterium]|jgi:ribosomal protein S18 acetylase RimI-like enzyme
MADVTVRHARPEDLEPLAQLVRGHVRDYYARPEPSAERVRALLGTLLYEKEGIVLVAEQDGGLAGFAILYFTFSTEHADKIAVLNDIHVIEELRRTGGGSALFDACRSYAKENGFAYLTWQVTKENTQAQGFFERMGATRQDWVSYSI